MDNRPIGVFDSGIGGLTVAKEIIKTLPNESIIYLGDTARVPYGTRSKEVITRFALEMVNFLLKKNVKFLVVACNTISAVAYVTIKKMSPVPVLGVLKPAVSQAAKTSRSGKIGVIGTIGTIRSDAYGELLRKFRADAEVTSSACPLFVPLAEEGFNNHLVTEIISEEYLKDIKNAGVDTIILGCTHYPLLIDSIKAVIGTGVNLVDSSLPTATMLKERLKDANLLSNNQNPTHEFYVTDAPGRVHQVAGRFFGEALNGKLQKISLED